MQKLPRSAALVLTLALGCSSATPEGTQPKGDGTGVVAGPGGPGEAPDTSPVPAPKSLLFVLRATSPQKTLDAVDKIVPLPQKLDALLRQATKGASAFFDLRESFDLAVALDPTTRDLDDPKVFVGFGVPLSADYQGLVDLIQREGDEVRQAGPGVWRIRGKGADSLACELYATGAARPRLVCADGTSAFREIGPWLARTLPTLPRPKEDLWFRLDAAPFRDLVVPKIGSEMDSGLGDLRKQMETFGVGDKELLDAPATAARELVAAIEELDRLEGALSLDAAKPELTLSAELGFRGNQAWFTKVMTQQAGKAAPPPDVFWKLPKDCESAFFGTSTDPALFTGIRRVAKKGLAQALDLGQKTKALKFMTDADKQAFVALVDALPTETGVWVSASGVVPGLPGGAAAAKPGAFTPQQAIAEAKNKARTILNWGIVGTEGDAAQAIKFLKQGSDAYARVIRMVKQEADEKVRSATPDMKKFRQERRKELDQAPKVRVVDNPAGYPKGSAVLEIDIELTSEDVWTWVHPEKSWDKRPEHPKGKAVRGTIPVRVAVVPGEGKRYFWGYSADVDVLKEKLSSLVKPAAVDKTLAARKELERLKRPMQAGGFVSYGRTLESLARLEDDARDLREVMQVINKLPNRLSSPVFVTVQGKGGRAPSIGVEMVFDKPWIADVAALVREVTR